MLNAPVMAFCVSTVLGFLAGLGVGGGSLLVMWLTLVLQYSHPEARIINLMFFLPSAIIATIFRWRQGALKFQSIVFPAALGCITAAIFSVVSKNWNTDYLKMLFGVLLLLAGIRELGYKSR